ncbi:hypothetical protein BCU70_09465 [Vibrio sp. 10N.286.49.C2]|uniref:CoA transferase n=1 Tax=unclassified Vibrio TaxID=2614977 RepID=UPI000CC0BC5D|nr:MULTISPECIES: CoA transferase [unclassified Vibrio]PMH26381.1 hypothetical protein BCU70_09465 [Vibrio sp. 10N.286.49.C2]PMH54895.1 hypothetical protein BCU66_11470 [Vibrio sp. 10N.286.49.B1]PMH79978.1 hypothetical protein BCU58_24440 [Vibrio sp. 10N.286.48.B7]
MNTNQHKVYQHIADTLNLSTPASDINIVQTPTYLKEDLATADYITGVIAAFGASLEEIGELRGLPKQSVTVDRRHATMSLNDPAYHYLNGTIILGGEIEVPVNSIQQSKDGQWLCMNGAYPHLRDGILNYFDSANNYQSLSDQVAKVDLATIEADFEEQGLCMAPLYTPEQWRAHPQGQAMAKHPLVLIDHQGDAKYKKLTQAKHRPLEGLKIIDVTHVVAGPWSTRQLAEYGADVISIRNPEFPFLYPVIFEQSYGKKQIQLNLKQQQHKEKFTELLKDADALVWGYGPNSLERLGFDKKTLMEINPNLVVTQISAYGPTGPWSNRKGWEQLAQTCTGMTHIASQDRDQYHLVGALTLDFSTGFLAAIGTISALIQREKKGGFWSVETMLARSAMELLSLEVEKEEVVPISMADMHEYLIDQTNESGSVFTRITPYVQLSETPAYCQTGPSVMGAHDPIMTTWSEEPAGNGVITHRPSEVVNRGLFGFIPGYGHEDIMLR